MKPVTPKTEPPPSAQLRKAVFGGSFKIIRPSIKQHLACCMAVLGVFWSVACPAAAPTYTLTDLGILPGYIESNAVAVNNAGQVAGNLFDSNGVTHAFIYSNGTMTVLGVVSGSDRATAESMNNAGQIVGIMGDGQGDSVAFSYFNGTTVSLGCSSCGSDSSAEDVNDSGEVVGVNSSIFSPSNAPNPISRSYSARRSGRSRMPPSRSPEGSARRKPSTPQMKTAGDLAITGGSFSSET